MLPGERLRTQFRILLNYCERTWRTIAHWYWGNSISAAEVCPRMDEEALFLELLEISSPAERESRLAAATEGNEVLRHRVEQLLKVHEQTGDFLRGSPASKVQ